MPTQNSFNLRRHDDVICAAAYRIGLHNLDDLYTAALSDTLYFFDVLYNQYPDDPHGALCEFLHGYLGIYNAVPYVPGDPKSEDLARHVQQLEEFSSQLPGRPTEDVRIVAETVLSAAQQTRRPNQGPQMGVEQAPGSNAATPRSVLAS